MTLMSDPTLEHRWLRFSLRTMFIVVAIAAVPSAWLGYTLNRIQQREVFISEECEIMRRKTRTPAGEPVFARAKSALYGRQFYRVNVLVENVDQITNAEHDHILEAQALFPEADIVPVHYDGQGTWTAKLAPHARVSIPAGE
jgi:hypothetical protein